MIGLLSSLKSSFALMSSDLLGFTVGGYISVITYKAMCKYKPVRRQIYSSYLLQVVIFLCRDFSVPSKKEFVLTCT